MPSEESYCMMTTPEKNKTTPGNAETPRAGIEEETAARETTDHQNENRNAPEK